MNELNLSEYFENHIVKNLQEEQRIIHIPVHKIKELNPILLSQYPVKASPLYRYLEKQNVQENDIIVLDVSTEISLKFNCVYDENKVPHLHPVESRISEIFKELGIKKSQAIWLSGSMNFCISNFREFYYNGILDWYIQKSSDINYKPKDINKTKHFMFLNRRPREHRIKMLHFLTKYNLLDKGFISYNINKEKPVKSFQRLSFLNPEEREFAQNQPPIYLDINQQLETEEFVTKEHEAPKRYWEQSFMSIIGETSCYSHKLAKDAYFLYPTEKIWRCYDNLHPFLLLAQPYTLKYLRDNGFDVFDDIFDNTYDEVVNTDARIAFVEKEVYKICSLSTNQLNGMYRQIYPRLEYNKRHLYEFYKKEQKRIHRELNNYIKGNDDFIM